jgi:hypothetical protein
MINFECLYYKYKFEHVEYLPGIFSDFDSKMLYSFIREYKPTRILDCAPREGKSLSAIFSALYKNCLIEGTKTINYWVFEKDQNYHFELFNYLKNITEKITSTGCKITVYFDDDVYENESLNKIDYLDFLFIDAAHDYILPAYMIDRFDPLMKNDSYIHFHDMHIKKDLSDIIFKNQPQDFDEDELKKTYSYYDKYYRPGLNWEGDIVNEYVSKNNYQWFSTHQYANILNLLKNIKVEHCSLYINKKDS